MSEEQFTLKNHLNLQYSLHPIISELNMDLLRQSPHNVLQFIKFWAAKKLKQMYSLEQDSEEQQQIEKQARISVHNKIIKANSNLPYKVLAENKPQPTKKRRRNAVVFAYTSDQRQKSIQQQQQQAINQVEVPKSQQAISRIMISLKNDSFFKNLSWQQIEYFVSMGKVFETKHEHQLLQCAYQTIDRFFILVSGQVYLANPEQEEVKIFYTGESFCHQSFLYLSTAEYSFYARQIGTLLFYIPGEQIKQALQKFSRDRFLFYEKVLMNKEQFNYLDMQQRDKLIRCFKERKEIMSGQVVFRGQIQGSVENKQKRFYVVVKGMFSKCKKSATGQLMAFKQLRQGDYFGEENLLMLANIEYTVICIQDNSQLGYFDKSSLEQVVDDYNRIIQRAKLQINFITT